MIPPFVFRFPVPEDQLYDIGNWHSPYFFLAFFQARVALFESFGVTQERIRQNGFAVIIKSLFCDYFAPLRRGDAALIEVVPKELGRSSMTFSYAVYKYGDAERKERALGTTVQSLVDRNTGKSAELPDWIRNPLLELLLLKET